LQKRSGRLRSRSAIRTQTVPLSWLGALRRIADAPWASASGATKVRAELPVGVPASVSSATLAPTVERSPVSSSSVKTRTGTVAGGRPERPTTAALASLEIVPSVWPAAASL
jgi:hypothetical protein